MPDNISVVVSPPIVVSVTQSSPTNVQISTQTGPDVAVVENGATPQNLFVGGAQPNMAAGGIWVEILPDGDMTMWIEDGT